MLIVDVALDSGSHRDELRLRLRHVAGQPDELISVARLEAGVQQPFGIEAYEALMAQTMPPVVSNESVIGTGESNVLVAGRSFACQRTSYQILTASSEATMTTFESPTFAWGDLGGEVVAKDGSLLYRAEVVDYGSAAAPASAPAEPASAVAAFEDEEYEPDYATEKLAADLYE
jgi:hypothetical protein